MATTVRLSRPSNQQPWGFRIHGGRDFHQPLIVLKVTGGSIASSSGLTPGDQISKINNQETSNLNHKDAENLIKNAGNAVEFEVYKTCTNTWKPNVQVLENNGGGAGVGGAAEVFTKTSLAKNQTGSSGTNFSNNVPRGFQVQPNQLLVNKQFNTPINMYSEQSIAETLSAQAEVLAGGAIGVNFKKNEKKYNYENSEVYKMLQEAESEQGDETAAPISPAISGKFPAHHFGPNQQQQERSFEPVKIPPVNLRPVQVPQQQQQQQPLPQQQVQQSPQQQSLPQQQVQQSPQQQSLPQQQQTVQSVSAPQHIPGVTGAGPAPTGGNNPNICAECERLIVGVFVRIKEKNLHVDCFKCSTCGQSLKNIGYFNINNKLYCDIHAKTVARATVNAPAPGLEPVALQPGQAPPTGAIPFDNNNSPGAVLPKPFSYTQQPLQPLPSLDSYASKIAPLPFHHSPSGGISHVTAPKSPQIGGISPKLPQQQQQLPPFQPLQLQPLLPQQQPIQQQPIQQQQQNNIIQQSSSSSYESFQKSSSSSYVTEQTLGGGSKVIWPPVDQPLLQQVGQTSPNKPIQQVTNQQVTNQQQPNQQISPNKFKQQQVPYKPLSSLLVASQNQQPQQTSQFNQQQQNQQFSQFGQTNAQQQLFNTQQGSFAQLPQQPSYAPAPQQPSYAPAPQQVPPQQQQQFSPVKKPVANKPSFGAVPPGGAGAGGGASGGAGSKSASSATIANRIGRGILTQPGGPSRIAVCGACQKQIRGPFITAGLRFYCPEHFKCSTCSRDLMEVGFVEEKSLLHCEFCWESNLAPVCGKCNKRVKYECLKAIGRDFHTNCFACKQCGKAFGKDSFFLEDGEPYCQNDWNEMFTTKCHGCGFPIEAGDRWVEAMNNNYHSQCFNCTACKKNLEGQSFFAKAGRPFCKSHAR